MKKARLLDSFALLAYLKKEKDYQKVKEILASHQTGEEDLLMNEINVGEVYYILARERSLDAAEYFLHDILQALDIKTVPNSLPDVIEAARIKAQFLIPYADAFAVATAVRYGATLVTGDLDFKKVEHLIDIDWLT
ncbi:MAG: type II toxin-antitoxin system VapC family toxin [Dehalococcoidia bacterium]|nr:type II toxin-antitoxin system VapC family toxin [Dehalococcoidia bacterium]